MKNKKIIILITCILVVILFMVGLYFYGLSPISKKSDKVKFTVEKGVGINKVLNDLYEANIIKSKISSLIYVKLHSNIIIQAGTYELDRNNNTTDILKILSGGKIIQDTINVTFIEGKRVTNYAKTISEKFGYSEEEVIKTLSNSDFLKKLISEYEFLDNSILNSDLYYPLEGYLFPATYEFYKTDSIENIIRKMLNKTNSILNELKEDINQSDYNVHEILTIASIIENESVGKKADVKYCSGKENEYVDRYVVSQVIHKRLDTNMSLGMDVTTYYGAKKELSETLTKVDINEINAYNTRPTSFLGLPVGPISNPSKDSIKAALNPSDTTCVYFYADMATSELHFAKTFAEHETNIKKYS